LKPLLALRNRDLGLAGSDPQNVPIVRGRVVNHLRSIGVPRDIIDDAGLCTSELVANGVEHTVGGWAYVEVSAALGELVVAVGSGSSKNGKPPHINRGVSPNATSGRGLDIVESLSSRMGFIEPSTADGREATVAWFALLRDSGLIQVSAVPPPSPAQAIDTLG